MYCAKCGKEIMDEAVICPGCGCPVAGKSIQQAGAEEDVANGILNIVGFLLPIVGLILFCVMIGKTPNKAKQIGIFSLVGFLINAVVWPLLFM